VTLPRSLGLVAAALATAVTGALSAAATTPTTGLYGTVMQGPTTPVCRAGIPCEGAAAKVVLTFTRAGHSATTRTGARGNYRIALTAGTYAVTASSQPFGQMIVPATVRVRVQRMLKVDFAIDTGLR